MAQIPSDRVRQGEPESLHGIAKGSDTGKKAKDNFISPGVPDSPMLTKEARKTGEISSAATSSLRKMADTGKEPGLTGKMLSDNLV